MSPADLALLRAVRERIATPERWVQGVFAGDRYGNKLDDGNAPDAVCWCLLGAVGSKMNTPVTEGEKAFATALGFDSIFDLVEWNDTPNRTHAEVLARIDAAIGKGE